MSNNTALVILIAIPFILFAGTPDIADGIIKLLNNIGACK